jgi:hypothetical protein
VAFNFISKLGASTSAITGTITPVTPTDWAIIAANTGGPTIAGWTATSTYSFQQLASAAPFFASYSNPSFGVPDHEYANILATFPTKGVVSIAQDMGSQSGGLGAGTYLFPGPPGGSGPPATTTAGNAILVIINKAGFAQNADPVVTDSAGNHYDKAYCTQIDTGYSVGAGLYVALNITGGLCRVQVVTSDQVSAIQVLEMVNITSPGGPYSFGNMMF